jgi:endogenous inhibitor of DNA gyrase (YacG/DUF329 family)
VAARPRVIDVLRAGSTAWRALHRPTPEQAQLLRDLKRCRTAALGGHLYACPACGEEVPVYNSCQNRCCPNCQALDQERWIRGREQVMLPLGHYHVVFTLPAQLRPLALRHPRQLYALLFAASADTLNGLAATVYGVRLGLTGVLHTWARDLALHPHTHFIVTAGGLTDDGCWVDRPHYLFPAARLRARFRARIVAGLERFRQQGKLLTAAQWRTLLRRLPRAKRWVVHIEAPRGRSTHVVQYLGRYTHRVAISDARLVAFDGKLVAFHTRDGKVAQLSTLAFTSRFMLHTLPRGLCKIRHFGLYSPALRPRLELARQLLPPVPAAADPAAEQAGLDPDRPPPARRCPSCGHPLHIQCWLPPCPVAAPHAVPRGPPA